MVQKRIGSPKDTSPLLGWRALFTACNKLLKTYTNSIDTPDMGILGRQTTGCCWNTAKKKKFSRARRPRVVGTIYGERTSEQCALSPCPYGRVCRITTKEREKYEPLSSRRILLLLTEFSARRAVLSCIFTLRWVAVKRSLCVPTTFVVQVQNVYNTKK